MEKLREPDCSLIFSEVKEKGIYREFRPEKNLKT